MDVQVLTSGAGEDAECHAAKLLEVILIQYKGLVDQVSLASCCFINVFYWYICLSLFLSSYELGSRISWKLESPGFYLLSL